MLTQEESAESAIKLEKNNLTVVPGIEIWYSRGSVFGVKTVRPLSKLERKDVLSGSGLLLGTYC